MWVQREYSREVMTTDRCRYSLTFSLKQIIQIAFDESVAKINKALKNHTGKSSHVFFSGTVMNNTWMQRRLIMAYCENLNLPKNFMFMSEAGKSACHKNISPDHYIAAGAAQCRQTPECASFFSSTLALPFEREDIHSIVGTSLRLAAVFRKVIC